MTNYTICHYDEIGLKGKNRIFFEKKLVQNIELKTKAEVKRLYGRILIESDKDFSDALSKIFGISNFSRASRAELDIEDIKKTILETLQNKKFTTFRITTKRSNKQFKYDSQQINEQVGQYVLDNLENKTVKLKQPNLTCYIEVLENQAFVYTEKISGPGGLPVGVSGKVVCLLSGGIDSPVAAWYAAKRGLEIIFVHFHSYPHTSKESVHKVEKLYDKLQEYNVGEKLYLCPFIELQKKIYTQVPDKLRIIFYRRFMFRIAQEIAKKEGALGIVTGEAIGQVASQTLENIDAISEVVDMPIIRPVIGFDKKEIITKAQQINTYDISVQPHDDCCIVFMPKNPETKAKKQEIYGLEDKLDVDNLVSESVKKCRVEKN